MSDNFCDGSFRQATNDSRLEAAFIFASDYAEESTLRPVRIPAVRDQPIGNIVLDAPSDQLHGMSANGISSHMLVNSGFIAQEIFVHRETCLHRSVRHNLGLDLRHIGLNREDGFSESLVLRIADVIRRADAAALALRRVTLTLARRSGAVDVMLAIVNRVRFAAFVAGVVSARAHAIAMPVLESHVRLASIASEAADVAARDHVLRGQVSILGALRRDADSIGHGFDR